MLQRNTVCMAIALQLASSPTWAGPWAEAPPPGKYFKLGPAVHKSAQSFKTGQPIVGTSYFYWYDVYSGAHIRNGDGSDAMTTHPPKEAMADLSYKSPGWHYSQLRDVCAAGIDFIMPVYWGFPGDYRGWSFVGLPPLVAAHDRMLAEHRRNRKNPLPPKIGLFYDTSTLSYHPGADAGTEPGRGADLTTERGREWFYVTIRDFFSMIPPDKWARIDGKPIVFLYSPSFAKHIDERLFDDARRRFVADFATDMFLVKHTGWPGRADASYTWGGALGLTLGDGVAGLGPGYDHSAVPGRKPLVVRREDGRFYERQWSKLLRMQPKRRPWIVHVETWNEWHEGTDVARSQEYGDLYIRLTAKYAKMFHDGLRVKPAGPYAGAKDVHWTPSKADGLKLLPSRGDGCWESVTIDGGPAVVSVAARDGIPGRYLYFDVDDSFMFDEDGAAVEVAIAYRDDGGCERFGIEYDNNDCRLGPVDGAFRSGPVFEVGNTGTWKTVNARLADVRFVNRANGGDFRLAVAGGAGRLTVSEVLVRRLGGE